MTEQAYLQGYKGPIYVNFCEIPVLASKVPKEWLEGRIVVASHDWEDPGMGKKANAIYAEAARRWDYVPSAIALPYEIGTVWEQGVKRAGTFDSTAVKNVLVDPKNEFQGVVEPFSTRYYGKWGKEVYGIENYLLPKKGPVLTIKNLKLTTVGWFDYEEFFTKNGDFVVKRLDQEGMLWNQRKK
jgi:ABC-type branched-subunit amino acid transport system substrate-binding protein